VLSARPFTREDINPLIENMRYCDVREVETLGDTVRGVLEYGLQRSNPGLVISSYLTGSPLAVFGVVPGGPENYPARRIQKSAHGDIWMLATDELVEKHGREFARASRGWVDFLNTQYRCLSNIVDARNTVHIRWLEWCGFTFTENFLINSHTFRAFERVR